jgi:threonine 3-dehydrogenase
VTPKPARIPTTAPAPRFLGGGRLGTWERDVPRPGPGEVLVAVRANAICGSDRPAFVDGWPIVPGHETAGVVAATGDRVTVATGTPGVIYLRDYCGSCRSCEVGATNQCLAKRADMGWTADGGYGPYELVHETNFFPIPIDLPMAEATLLLDVMGTTGHGIARARLVTPDIRAVAVSGAGPLGLGMVVMTRLLLGASVPVVVSDLQPARLELVERLGGRAVDLRSRSLADGLMANGLKEVDVAFDTAGRTESRRQLLDVVAARGTLVCLGAPEELHLTVHPDLVWPERAIMGSEYFPFGDLERNLGLLMANRGSLQPIVTHRFGVADLQAALDLFMSSVTGKVVVER